MIVTDPPCNIIGKIFWEEACRISDSVLVEIAPRKIHGEEPPLVVSKMIRDCDIFIMPTSMSLTHTRARIEATKAGCRGATLPGITQDIMARTLNADYQKIKKTSLKLARLLTKSKTAWVTTRKGTNLILKISGRHGHADTGIMYGPGDFSNLPAGEAYIAPVEGSAQGQIVIDGSMAPFGRLKNDLILIIENGEIKGIANDNVHLYKILKKYGPKSRNVAELGIGTNNFAKITGEVLEDEKVLGTIHIAFGNNFAFGGKVAVPIHLDGVIKSPTLYLDGRLIMKDGSFTV